MAPASDDDHQRKGERRDKREPVARQAALARPPEHQSDPGQRQGHGHACAPRDRLAERDPGEQRGQYGSDRQDDQNTGDARVVQRSDEAARSGRDTQRHRYAGEPHGPECLHHPAAFHDRHVREERGAREGGAPHDLRGRVKRELALEDAGGRPRDRGECHVDLPAPPAPRLPERHRRRRHAPRNSGRRAHPTTSKTAAALT